VFKAPAELRAKLLIPHLGERAKSLMLRLDQARQDDYDEVKSFLLDEFQLTPFSSRVVLIRRNAPVMKLGLCFVLVLKTCLSIIVVAVMFDAILNVYSRCLWLIVLRHVCHSLV
jgi:hypothetical protein